MRQSASYGHRNSLTTRVVCYVTTGYGIPVGHPATAVTARPSQPQTGRVAPAAGAPARTYVGFTSPGNVYLSSSHASVGVAMGSSGCSCTSRAGIPSKFAQFDLIFSVQQRYLGLRDIQGEHKKVSPYDFC